MADEDLAPLDKADGGGGAGGGGKPGGGGPPVGPVLDHLLLHREETPGSPSAPSDRPRSRSPGRRSDSDIVVSKSKAKTS